MQQMTLAEIHVGRSVILMDLLGPDIFSTLWTKGQVLHRERAHSLKVPDWSLVWNELLTKKLPLFLSCLNEISGGCEKIVPVSESFWSYLKFLRMIDLTAWLWGWNVRVNGMRSVSSFSAVFSADFRKPYGTVVARLNDRTRIATLTEKLAHCIWFLEHRPLPSIEILMSRKAMFPLSHQRKLRNELSRSGTQTW